jgi:rifampicin phosphotransferase
MFKTALVAVRSSATAEDLPGMSLRGNRQPILTSKAKTTCLLRFVIVGHRFLQLEQFFYRAQNKIPTEKVKISVIVQKMVHLMFQE